MEETTSLVSRPQLPLQRVGWTPPEPIFEVTRETMGLDSCDPDPYLDYRWMMGKGGVPVQRPTERVSPHEEATGVTSGPNRTTTRLTPFSGVVWPELGGRDEAIPPLQKPPRCRGKEVCSVTATCPLLRPFLKLVGLRVFLTERCPMTPQRALFPTKKKASDRSTQPFFERE